jgi:hypothetical protein
MSRLIVALATVFLSSIAFAADQTPPPAPQGKTRKEPETELGKHMAKMNDAFRTLRRQASDASKNAESLELVVALRDRAKASLELEPAKAASIPEADRAKWIADYRAGMRETVALMEKLEAAFRANQNEEAVKLIAEINSQQRAGHKEFRPEQKRGQ